MMNNKSLGSGSTEQFFSFEYSTLDLKDKRLNNRALQLFYALQSRLTTCVRRLGLSDNDTRQAYDFFSNPKVSGEALLEPHYKNTAKRINESNAKYILAIQDSIILNYTTHKAKTDLGRIGKVGQTQQHGLIQHNTLIVTDKNESLGLIDLQHFNYDDFDQTIHNKFRPIEEKQSSVWISALKNMRKLINNPDKKIITVADREADFFEFMHEFYIHQESFVIRAFHNRNTGATPVKTEAKLISLLRETDDIGTIVRPIYDAKTRQLKDVEFKIKRLTSVQLPPPRFARGENAINYKPIFINAVMAYNDNQSWTLLTDLSVNNLEDCCVVIDIYRARWHIEDYHKILKTGYQVDELYLHSSREAIENALVMAAISACRLYWMIYVGRVEKTVAASRLFKDFEWKSLYVYFKEKVPTEAPPLSEIILKIARLGGYKSHKKSSPPGIKCMWLGMQSFVVAAEMYKNIMESKT